MKEIATVYPQMRVAGMDGGRTSLMTVDRVNKILQCLRDGNTKKCAAQSNGISEHTIYTWINLHKDFAAAVAKAEADAEKMFLGVIRKAATPQVTKETTTTTNADGTVVVTIKEKIVNDWRAAESYLKHTKTEWADKLDIRKVDDVTILRLLETETVAVEPPLLLESSTSENEIIDADIIVKHSKRKKP